MFSLKIVPIFSMLIIKTIARTEWIDPFSLDGDITIEPDSICPAGCSENNELITSHFKRSLNSFLNTLNYDRSSQTYTARIHPDLTVDEYDFLKKFADNLIGDAKVWNQVDLIMSKMYTKSILDEFFEQTLHWKDQLKEQIFSYEFLVISIGLLILYAMVQLLRRELTMWGIFKYLMVGIFIADFVFTWIRLMKEKEIDKVLNTIKYKGSIPRECDPSSMSWFELLINYNGKDKCKEYYQVQHIDVIWSVGIGEVFGTQIGTFVKTPSEAFGAAFALFYSGIISNLSWYTWPLIPFLLIFIIFFICITLSFITSTSIEFNFFHMIKFSFGKEDRAKLKDSMSGQTLNKFLDVLQMGISSPRQRNKIKADIGAGGDYIQEVTPQNIKKRKSLVDESPVLIIERKKENNTGDGIVKEKKKLSDEKEFKENDNQQNVNDKSNTDLQVNIESQTLGDIENVGMKIEQTEKDAT